MLRFLCVFCLLILALLALAYASPAIAQTVPPVHLPIVRRVPPETPLVVDSTTGIASTALSTYTVETPDHANGDLLLIAAATDSFTTTLNGPAGWTILRATQPIQTAARYGLWSTNATASEPESFIVRNIRPNGRGAPGAWLALSITGGSGLHAQGEDTSGAGTTATLPDITTTVDKCLLVAFVFTDRLALPLTAPEGWTKVAETGVDTGATVGVFTKVKTTAGTESGPAIGLGVREQWAGVTLAIAPLAPTK
jgi:hypothetical protein